MSLRGQFVLRVKEMYRKFVRPKRKKKQEIAERKNMANNAVFKSVKIIDGR